MVVRLKLLPCHEIIGYLSKIALNGQHVKLVFTITREVEMPAEAFSYDELKSYIGKRISIFHLNDQFFIKEVQEEEEDGDND